MPEVGDLRRGLPESALRVVGHEHELDDVGLADPDVIPMREGVCGSDGLAVHERAEAGAAVRNHVAAVLERDGRVFARHIAADDLQVRRGPPADREDRFVHRHRALTLGIGDVQSWRWRHAGLARSTPICTRSPVKS